ncbi:DEAD/DEAH box helicase [Candidatus Saccharibacteria bacterium CPR2]|nr:DEAD/DEAH box helicase [Candidatus Saccharibacteria bacterium CPR2]
MSYINTYRTKNNTNSRSRKWNNSRPTRSRSKSRRIGQYIDPSRFIKIATASNEKPYEPKHTFSDFLISDKLKSNLAAKRYITPSHIQDQAIPIGLSGKDVIGIASTGTGKTAAFAIPIIQNLTTDSSSSAIIVAPTRELAQQIEEEFRELSRGCGLYSTLLIGGASMGRQLSELRRNPRIIIGTPGRIMDHLKRRALRLDKFNLVVLDEVDRMLDMGFVQDVSDILKQTSQQRQIFFFSATMDTRVRKLIENFSTNPTTISVKAGLASENVHQDVIKFQHNNEKLDKLHDILINKDVSKAIIFDETQRDVEHLAVELVSRGFSTEALHGGKSQGQRRRALSMFKSNQVNILVATDVAARGIDVADITHVINFSIPKVYDDYIHRIGRTGRAGRVGYALTFVENRSNSY